MRVSLTILYVLFCVAGAHAGPVAPASAPATLTQVEAQALSSQVNELGSDQSLRASTTRAMQALIQFGDNDLRGAITNAYSAYGAFKGSENLDRMRKQNLLHKNSLVSAGSGTGLTAEEEKFLTSSTSYRRLDPSFLHQGEDAKIAEEFERKTGMKRGDFLNVMADAAENKLYVSDPQLAEKLQARFEGFVEKIPNPEFKAKVQSAMKLLPSAERQKLVVQAVQNMVQVAQKFMGGNAAPSDIALATGAPAPAAAEAAVPNARVPASEGEASRSTDPALRDLDDILPTASLNADRIARSDGDGKVTHRLDSVIKAAVTAENENDTIFVIVTRRYRALTPSLAR